MGIGICLVGIFLVFAGLMMFQKLHVMLALPLLAVGLAVCAGFPTFFHDISPHKPLVEAVFLSANQTTQFVLDSVIGEGIPRLHNVMISVMLGGIFGMFLKLSGVTESLFKKVAELVGGHPFSLMMSLSFVVMLLFTTLGGLGSIILVANIYFPVLLSQGIPPLIIGSGFLLAISIGGILNLMDWTLYSDVLNLSAHEILHFAAPFSVLMVMMFFVFVVVEFRRASLLVPLGSVMKMVGILAGVGISVVVLPRLIGMDAQVGVWLKILVGFGMLGLSVLGIRVKSAQLFAPAVPLAMVLFFNMGINAAFLTGIVYLFIGSQKQVGGRVKIFLQSAVEGVQNVVPAVVLIMGIGMIFVAVTKPPVSQAMAPLLQWVLPSSLLGYVVVFAILAPLALYRGPLNLWGMGSGIVGLIRAGGIVSPFLTMAAFMSCGQLQGVCDPTNTHNVWVANALKIDTQALLRKTLPYVWATATLGLILAVILFKI